MDPANPGALDKDSIADSRVFRFHPTLTVDVFRNRKYPLWQLLQR
jgi:hypothetical protein